MRRNSKWARDSEEALRRISFLNTDTETPRNVIEANEEQEADSKEPKPQSRQPRRPTFSARRKRSSLGGRRFTVKPGALVGGLPASHLEVKREQEEGGALDVKFLGDEEVEKRRRKRRVQRGTAFRQEMRGEDEPKAIRALANSDEEGLQFDVIDFDFAEDLSAYDEEIEVGFAGSRNCYVNRRHALIPVLIF